MEKNIFFPTCNNNNNKKKRNMWKLWKEFVEADRMTDDPVIIKSL